MNLSKIIDNEHNELPPGESGEIAISGGLNVYPAQVGEIL